VSEGSALIVPPRVGPLNTLSAVRRELVKIYREARQGTLASTEATRLTYILQAIGKILEQTDLEKRVEDLERAAKALTHQERPRMP